MPREGDVVVVAGKGHEDYQEIKGVKYPFKDSQVVKEALGAVSYTHLTLPTILRV